MRIKTLEFATRTQSNIERTVSSGTKLIETEPELESVSATAQ
jgi:hypothetical protein